jgi:hypothetical protein
MTSSSALTLEVLERLRDKTFRRIPRLRVRGERSALAFITEIGFCSTFHRVREPLPCLWVAVCGRRNPRFPKHTHTDPYVGLTWLLKDLLPAKRRVYYGKLLKGRPTLVSLDCFPAFFRLIRGEKGSGDYLSDYRAGHMTRTAKVVMDALQEMHPQYTPELRVTCRLKAPGAHPGVRTGNGGAAAGPLDRENGGAIRAIIQLSVGSARLLAGGAGYGCSEARSGRSGVSPCPKAHRGRSL